MNKKSSIVRGLLTLLLGSISFLSIAQGQQGISVDKIIARVDNYYILRSELEELYQSYKTEGQTPQRCQLLESLIINKMLLAKAEIDSVTVEDKDVDNQLDGRMSYMIQRFGSEKNLVEAYGKTIDALKTELRQQVKDQAIVETMQQKIAGDVKITPSDVRKFFNAIPKDSLPYIPSEVEVGHIIRLATITKEQKDKLRQQLIDLKKRAADGEDFAMLAQVYSEDIGSAKNGGDLGFAKRGMMVPEFEGTALALKPNEISNIVETQFGFHLIQMIETRGAEYHARHILLRPDYNRGTDISEAVQYLDSVRVLIKADSISFATAAKGNSEDKLTSDAGGILSDPQTGLGRIALDASMDPALYFALDSMKVDQISTPISYRTEDGRTAMRILWYKSKSEPHTANFRDDYEKLGQIVLSNKKNNALELWFKKAAGDVFISVDDEFQNCRIFGLSPTGSQ